MEWGAVTRRPDQNCGYGNASRGSVNGIEPNRGSELVVPLRLPVFILYPRAL